jgi:hypothetical protein
MECVCAPMRFVSFTWSIEDAATRQPLTCNQVPASTVRFTLGGQNYDFSCGASRGQTPGGVAAGTSNGTFSLLASNGSMVSQIGTMPVTVPACASVDLGAVVFDVN